jgi:hypothetical protein
MKFIDAFKLNDAPRETKEGMFSDYTVYLPEAYTDEYMIRSDKTGRLCRYVVEHENGDKESVYGYYGVRKSTKYPYRSVSKILAKMSKKEVYHFCRTICPVRFEKQDDAIDWLKTFKVQYCNNGSDQKHPELYAIYNCGFVSAFMYATWTQFEKYEA